MKKCFKECSQSKCISIILVFTSNNCTNLKVSGCHMNRPVTSSINESDCSVNVRIYLALLNSKSTFHCLLYTSTVLSAKSDSNVMFCFQNYLRIIID